MARWVKWMVFWATGAAVQLDLDCAAPERARALIEYARLSEIEQVEDIHRDLLDKALARCPAGAGREPCRAERRRQADLDWERKLAEIKARYEKMQKEFEQQCRASIVLNGLAPASLTKCRLARRVQMRGGARRAAREA
jgi:hypothetical protein